MAMGSTVCFPIALECKNSNRKELGPFPKTFAENHYQNPVPSVNNKKSISPIQNSQVFYPSKCSAVAKVTSPSASHSSLCPRNSTHS